jgi:hypothetical protein
MVNSFNDKLIDKIYCLTSKYNGKIFDVLIEGKKIIFCFDNSIDIGFIDIVSKELPDYQIEIE